MRAPDEPPPADAGATDVVREYPAALDDAPPDPAGVTRWVPEAISRHRSGHRLPHGEYGRQVFSCGLNVMIGSGSGIVLDARASPARTADEPIAAWRMIDRVRARHGVLRRVLAADTGHGSGRSLAWPEGQGIEAHVPPMGSRDGTGRHPPRAAFT